jgi:hypothetical protein
MSTTAPPPATRADAATTAEFVSKVARGCSDPKATLTPPAFDPPLTMADVDEILAMTPPETRKRGRQLVQITWYHKRGTASIPATVRSVNLGRIDPTDPLAVLMKKLYDTHDPKTETLVVADFLGCDGAGAANQRMFLRAWP